MKKIISVLFILLLIGGGVSAYHAYRLNKLASYYENLNSEYSRVCANMSASYSKSLKKSDRLRKDEFADWQKQVQVRGDISGIFRYEEHFKTLTDAVRMDIQTQISRCISLAEQILLAKPTNMTPLDEYYFNHDATRRMENFRSQMKKALSQQFDSEEVEPSLKHFFTCQATDDEFQALTQNFRACEATEKSLTELSLTYPYLVLNKKFTIKDRARMDEFFALTARESYPLFRVGDNVDITLPDGVRLKGVLRSMPPKDGFARLSVGGMVVVLDEHASKELRCCFDEATNHRVRQQLFDKWHKGYEAYVENLKKASLSIQNISRLHRCYEKGIVYSTSTGWMRIEEFIEEAIATNVSRF